MSRRVFSFSTLRSRCHSFSSTVGSDYVVCSIIFDDTDAYKARLINYVCDDAAEAILVLKRRAERLVDLGTT
jgi:hypothetical protein